MIIISNMHFKQKLDDREEKSIKCSKVERCIKTFLQYLFLHKTNILNLHNKRVQFEGKLTFYFILFNRIISYLG